MYYGIMKSQDILILLKIFLWEDDKWSIAEIARSIGMSASETHGAIKRSEKSGLYSAITKKPVIPALEEFIIHGIKYSFPVEPGAPDRGVPTAHSALPLSEIIIDNEDAYVWPYDKGTVRGLSIKPLYSTVPEACLKDKKLHQMLSLIDGIRIGRVREKKIAEKLIIEMLRGENSEDITNRND